MKCPRCTDSTLEQLQKKGVEFHGCRQCKGLLVERDSLMRLFAAAQAQAARERPASDGDYFKSLVSASEFTDSNVALTCPKCRYNMYETEIHSGTRSQTRRGIKLDFCLNCQSIWFDPGELQQIVQRLKQGETFNLVPLPETEVAHATGLILQILRDDWL